MSYRGMGIVDVLPSWEVVVLECGGSACHTYIIHLIFGIGPTEDIKARIKGRGRGFVVKFDQSSLPSSEPSCHSRNLSTYRFHLRQTPPCPEG